MTSRRGAFAARIAAIALSTWPYWAELSLRPCETDDVLWVARSATSNPDWFNWLLRESHFVGYRPVPAASFVLDWVLSGGAFVAPVYHATDLLLHVLTAALVLPLYRALFPELPAWGGVLATLVFVAHPGVAEVLPWFSRRSYVLATLAGAGSVWFAARDRPVASAVALAAALLSNEVAFLVPGVLLLLAWSRRGAAGVRGAWAVPVVAVAVFVARYGIVGRVGGYEFSDRGPARIVGVMREAIAYLWAPTHTAQAATDVAVAGGGVIAVYYLARAVRLPGGRVAVAWLAASVLLIGATQTWFFRLTYPMLIPLAVLVGAVAASTRGLVAALPQVALLGWLLAQSPVGRGAPPAGLLHRREVDARMAALEEVLAPGLGATDLLLVTPYSPVADANPYWNGGSRWSGKYLRMWGLFQVRGTRTDVRQLALVRVRASGAPPAPRVVTDSEPAVLFPTGAELYVWPEVKEDHRTLAEDLLVPLSEMKIKPQRGALIYFVPPLEGGVVPLTR